MKIVAHVSPYRYLVEVSDDEIAQIRGTKSAPYAHGANAFPVGQVFDIHALWKIIENCRSREEKLTQAASLLRNISESIDFMKGALHPPETEPKTENGT